MVEENKEKEYLNKFKIPNQDRRLFAGLIDNTIFITLYYILMIFDVFIYQIFDYNDFFIFIGMFLPILIINVIVGLFESSKYQATPGKIILKLKIVNKNGNKLSFKKGFLRSFVFAITVILIWFFTFIPSQFGKYGESVHDKLTKTYVVQNKK